MVSQPSRALLINPSAGRFRRHPGEAERLIKELAGWGRLYQSYSLESLDELARAIRRQQPAELVIAGGDGTLNRTLAALQKAYRPAPLPRLLLLPAGTMNVVAGALNLRGSPPSLLQKVIAAWHSGRPLATRRLAFLTVNGHLGFIFGLGCFERLISLYARCPGRVHGLWLLLRALAAASGWSQSESDTFFPELEMDLHLDGAPSQRQRSVGVGVSTVDHLGFGFRPFFLAAGQVSQGHFILLQKPLAPLLTRLPALYRGRPARHPSLQDRLLQHLVIKIASPEPYMMDGELHPPAAVFDVAVEGSAEFIYP